MGPSTDRVTTSCVPWYFAACSIIRWHSKGQSCINPSIRTSLRWFCRCRTIRRLYGRTAGWVHGIDMNFTAQNASRKWAYGAFRRIEPAMVTVAAVALLLGMPTRTGGGGKTAPAAPRGGPFLVVVARGAGGAPVPGGPGGGAAPARARRPA